MSNLAFVLICCSVFIFCMSSQQGDTPLMMATKKEMVDTVKLLLDRGADSSSRDQVNYLMQNTLN